MATKMHKKHKDKGMIGFRAAAFFSAALCAFLWPMPELLKSEID